MPVQRRRQTQRRRRRRAAGGAQSHRRLRTNTCAPVTDFYQTLNHRWQRRTTLPLTETRITQAYFVAKEIHRELADIIRRQKSGPIADLLASWDTAAASHGLTPILLALQHADVSPAIGWLNRHGFGAPLSVYVQGDPRNHAVCRVFIDLGELGIGIPEYWSWREYAATRAAYQRYVSSLADTLGLPILREGIAAEREIAGLIPAATDGEGTKERFDMLTWAELRRRFAHIDWHALFVSYGIPEDRLGGLMYNVTAPRFLYRFQKRVASWPATRWHGWFALIAAQRVAGMSPHGPLRSAWFQYARRHLQGMPRDETAEELRMAAVRALLPNTLGKLWVQHHCPADLRRRVSDLVERVRDAAITAVRSTSWMSTSTRAAAADKLRRMDVQICWPEPWDLTDLACGGLNPTDWIENLLTLSAAATDQMLEQLRRGCRSPLTGGWPRPVYEVNAYYYPEENRFVLPAAILRPPFYDPRKSAIWNYGAIGATIGHEFCHAFDADGRAYDSRGDKHDWWTARDDREYRARARRVVDLYESKEYRGLPVNGELTLVENIADLGGLEFALAAATATAGRALTDAELREFFTAYAVSWRSKDRLARARELLVTDPHAPPRLRVNHAVRQFDEWYRAFAIDPSCPDYIPAERRIRFFR